MKMTLRVTDIEIGMSGSIRAPQYGMPKLKVREVRVDRKKFSQAQLTELAKLMKETLK